MNSYLVYMMGAVNVMEPEEKEQVSFVYISSLAHAPNVLLIVSMELPTKQQMIKMFSKSCPDFEPMCYCCRMWRIWEEAMFLQEEIKDYEKNYRKTFIRNV